MRSSLALAAAALFTLAGTAPATAQKPAPPALGPMVAYQYWPTQYIQFVTGPELPYSMFLFQADTSNAKQPVYQATLTGRDGTSTSYTNSDALAAALKGAGNTIYKTDFAVESDESDKVGATTTVRFSTHDEKPVEFRFVQGSDISEQGSGLQPLPEVPFPIFAYRELGALAGEGTALKVGSAVSTAEVWKEFAHPPYFVPYRGAVTSSAHQVVFFKGTQTWTVSKYPAALTAGNSWELDDDRHDHATLRIEKVDGAKFTFAVTDRFHPSIREVIEATRTGDTFATDRVLYMPASKGGEKHAVALSFTPGLGAGATSTMDLAIGKKKGIATATLTATGDAADRTVALQFTAPAWVSSKTLAEETAVSGDTITRTAR